jgi:REP element-mobilizing transposase RayT
VRYWLLTSTFYGNWLPGDCRGFVGRVLELRSGDDTKARRREHDRPGEEYDCDLPRLQRESQRLMKGDPIRINSEQAAALIQQFKETCVFRGWDLLASAVMPDHVHWVVGIDSSDHGAVGLQSLKAYGSRVLNQKWGRPPSETWWTSKGSARPLRDPRAVRDALDYVAYRQPNPLTVWVADLLPEWMPPSRRHGRLTSAAR